MAKRSNPYSEDYIQQSKTHVSLKKFNNNEERLKNVYELAENLMYDIFTHDGKGIEKTLQLLYKGAKKTLQHSQIQCSDVSSTENKNSMKFKQLFISKDGGLLHSGTLTENHRATEQCSCSGLALDSCSYCENPLCAECQQRCTICHLLYCCKCSLTGSEGTEICVSCYT